MDFSALNKRSSDSFAEQKNLIKRLSKGQRVVCRQCGGEISLVKVSDNQAKASCPKGCTDILLDLAGQP